MDIVQKIGIHNRFDIEVIDAKTGEVKQRAQAENIITNNLWNVLLNLSHGNGNYNYFLYIFYGSGTGTPSVNDTSLFNHVAAVSAGGTSGLSDQGITYSYNLKQGVCSAKRSIQLSESTAVGVNITEVGIGYSSASNALCTHAMLQDMNGNPISILKTNTDIINIYATVYCHWQQTGIFYPCWQAEGYGNNGPCFRGWILGTAAFRGLESSCQPINLWPIKEDVYGQPTYFNNNTQRYLTTSNSTAATSFSYNVTNKTITFNFPRIAIGEWNVGGIGGFWLQSYEYIWSMMIGEASIYLPVSLFYTGDNITNESVGTGNGTTTSFSTKFDLPENAKVYINGIEQTSGVIVKRIPCGKWTGLAYYMKRLWYEDDDRFILPYLYQDYTGHEPSSLNWTGTTLILENPFYQDLGFRAWYPGGNSDKLYGKNNLSDDWTLIVENAQMWSEYPLNNITGHYHYYKAIQTNSSAELRFETLGKNIVFDTPPAQGDIITIDYHTPYIAKDADHVFDFSYTLQFGEYTPAP